MIKKLLVGIAVSTVFIWLTLKGIDLKEVMAGLRNKSYGFLLPIALVVILTQVVRSVRWGVILSPIKKIDQRTLFPITSIGFLAIIVAPMRFGEVVRPYLISVKNSVPFGSGIATILIERSMDLLMLLVFFFVMLSRISLPAWVTKGGWSLLAIILLEFLFIILFMIFPERIKRIIFPITKRLPIKIAKGFEAFIENIAKGFRIISSIKKFGQILFLSFVVWSLSAWTVYLIFSFSNMRLGMLEAIAVTTITALGISLPTAPGLIGNFQFACMLALSLWGVSKNEAFTFAMVFYFNSVGINIVLGLIFLPFINIPFREMFNTQAREKNNLLISRDH
jgi:uncharacterized protein (TIRG00374 family)